MRLTPGCLIALIQINCFPYEDQITALNGSPAADHWVDQMLKYGLIEYDPQDPDEGRPHSVLRTTERGKKHIGNVCNLALPERIWI